MKLDERMLQEWRIRNTEGFTNKELYEREIYLTRLQNWKPKKE